MRVAALKCLTPSLPMKPSSKLFLALSQAPPPDVIEIATKRPLTMTPRSDAPKAAKAYALEPEIKRRQNKRPTAQAPAEARARSFP